MLFIYNYFKLLFLFFSGGQKGCPKDAIEAHLDEILNTLEYDVEPLFNHLESKKAIRFDLKPVIDKQVTEKAKLDILLKKLITTDNGWEAFVSYLKSHHHVRLANKLENSSGMTVS